MTLPIAHVGHWLVDLLWLLPVVIIVAVLVVERRRDARRHGVERSEPTAPADTPPPAA